MYLHLNKKVVLAFIACVVSTLFLQVNAGEISGTVIDAADNSPLGQSTIKLLSARDSAFVKGTATDMNGKFNISGVNFGRYIIQISYIGYSNANKPLRLTAESPNANLGKIALKENTIMLKETTVVGVKTEIKVKEDTVEYNADSYKTQPNSVVEDLLKRLPGVEIGTDGKITSGGKEITKILVDGKEFFADDPKVATKNIPVGIVDKLQVVDRKSDLARTTGVDDGEDETVINLTIKKGMNNGWFGNVTGGYGTDNRYLFNGMVNRFWDGNQITILGGANNTNNLGFTDGNSSRFRRFGGSNGIDKSQNIGLNFNVGKGETFRVGGDLMYSHSDKDTRDRIDRQYIFPDSSSYYNSQSVARDRGHNIRGDFRLKWDIDSLNTFEFRPNFSLNFNDSEKTDSSSTTAGDKLRTLVNTNKNSYSSTGKSVEFGGELLFNHKFKERLGRAFSIQLRYNLSNVHEDGTTYSRTLYKLKDEEDITDQIYNNHTWSNNVRSRLTWTEPIGDPKNARFFQVSYTAQYKWNNADKLVYDRIGTNSASQTPETGRDFMISRDLANHLASIWGPAVLTDETLARTLVNDDYEFNSDLSNQFRNDFFSQRVQVGYKQVRKQYNLDLGVSLEPAMSKSENLINNAKNIPTRWVWNVAPYLRFRYKFSKTTNFSADYRARSSQPSMAQLQPVADTSNPLRVVVGNPNLKPTFTNNINVRFSDFNQESQRSIMAMVRSQFSSNSIISTTKYNAETGGQITSYENVNGEWNIMAMGMVSLPFRNKHWQFSNHLFTRYNVSKGYINSNYNRSSSFSINEAVGLSYRTDVIEFEGRPYYSLQTTTNSVQGQSTPTVHTYGGTLFGSYYLPFGLSFNTDVTYTATSGYNDGFNKNEWMWNAAISYQFLKGKSATLALKAYDLLQQKQNISRSVTANYIQDSEYNSLTRYFMVTLAYRFNTFGGGKVPENKYQDFNRRGGHGGRR